MDTSSAEQESTASILNLIDFFFFFFLANSLNLFPVDSEKPGVCPKPRTDIHTEAGCLDQCSTDSECQGNRKCCFDGCGHVCEKPI
uniref:WAP domain-containing protein n=1 Tax=Periophthalmus magnuspinnatus TaxID=409849 RepID=A0A3B4BLA4_9GOBI